jgi:hypothetical protein
LPDSFFLRLSLLHPVLLLLMALLCRQCLIPSATRTPSRERERRKKKQQLQLASKQKANGNSSSNVEEEKEKWTWRWWKSIKWTRSLFFCMHQVNQTLIDLAHGQYDLVFIKRLKKCAKKGYIYQKELEEKNNKNRRQTLESLLPRCFYLWNIFTWF